MIDIEKFKRDGWIIVDIPNPEIIYEMRAFIGAENVSIDDIQNLSQGIWDGEFSLKIADVMFPIIRQFIGLNVMVQYFPYLRIARPGKSQDNIGYHKDTQYGQTPFELAVHIPFVDLDEKSAIRVISGSHLMPESLFPRVTPDGKGVEKGSIENHMGRPYMPKCLRVPDGMETVPLAMKVGQAAIFSPAIFHGQEVNEGDKTRVSCDLRFVSSFHGDRVRIGEVHAGYVNISESPMEEIARQYYEAQK